MKEEEIRPAEIAVDELGEKSSISNDDALLISMGKAPQLKRVYNFWTCMWKPFDLLVS